MHPIRYIPQTRKLSLMESVWHFILTAEWRREYVEQIPISEDHPEYKEAPPSQLNLKFTFTGLSDPFPFVIFEWGGKSKEMTRVEAWLFCETLADKGSEKTKHICRAIREKLREKV